MLQNSYISVSVVFYLPDSLLFSEWKQVTLCYLILICKIELEELCVNVSLIHM